MSAAAAAQVPASCRAEVVAGLAAGEQRDAGCAAQQARVTQKLLASGRQRSFGMVERQTVRLASVGLVLSQAHHCRRWPLRGRGERTLDVGAARAAGCSVRRYSGPLAIGVTTAGGTVLPVLTARADEDGRVEVKLAEVDALLRARGQGGLLTFAQLVLGAQGWAGQVDLHELRTQLAGWHATWVGRGRGSPGLFVALHADDGGAATLRVRALEATLERQADDMAAVERGELSARRFLERHAWSPYRSQVERLEDERPR